MNRKIKAIYNNTLGRFLLRILRKLKYLESRLLNYIKRLLFPLYLFPIKLLTYTFYYILKAVAKFFFELATLFWETVLFPFRSVKNFIKSIVIVFFFFYLFITTIVMIDYLYTQYGWWGKVLCTGGVKERLKSSVVRVVGGYSEGSGFFIDENTILTNFHVITGEPSPKIIFPDGSFTTVTKMVGDPQIDLALLDINENHADKVLAPYSFRFLNEDEPLIAVGYPGGTSITGEPTLLKGRYITIRSSTQDPVVYLHTDINIAPGMSGGPLVDQCGKFVGINTAGISGNSFFISVETYLEYKLGFSDIYVTKIKPDPSKSPEEAVKAFYTYLKVRDMNSGFTLLSSEYLKTTNFEEWADRFADVIDVTVISTAPVDWPQNTAYVKFMTKNWVHNEVYMHYYEGIWETVFEDGAYKMLRADIEEVENPGRMWFWTSN